MQTMELYKLTRLEVCINWQTCISQLKFKVNHTKIPFLRECFDKFLIFEIVDELIVESLSKIDVIVIK